MAISRLFLSMLFVSLFWIVSCNSDEQASKTDESDPAVDTSTAQERANPVGYTELTWEQLSHVTFQPRYYEEIQDSLLFPFFAPEVTALAGDSVIITGYVIPLQEGIYFLSKTSFASCFFCGGAGPETVVELELRDKDAMFANDDFLTFKGVLKINDTDIERLNYILEDAEVIAAG